MTELAVLLRFKQFLVHNMHNEASRVAFLPDHDYLGEIYGKAEGQYDSVVERMMGLSQPIDLKNVQMMAVQKLNAVGPSKDDTAMFGTILGVNKQILNLIEMMCKSGKLSQGTLQLVGGIADEIEGEGYKLVQRTKK